MKKDILFMVSDMESGGVEKSLISLLQCFDYSRYNVDLMILLPKGIFMKCIPAEVIIIESNIDENFFTSFPKSVINLIKRKRFILAVKRCISFIISRINKGYGAVYMSKQIPKIDKSYDVAIDYNGQHILYYMIDKIKAKKKITYFHSDYKKWCYYKLTDQKYYQKVDYIVTISEICKNSIQELFPNCAYKVKVIENISSPKIINMMSKLEYELSEDFIYDGLKIITVGRPTDVKGYDLAIEACSKLKADGYEFKWYSIGTSDQISRYKKIAEKYNVEKEFIFIGETMNPYTYVSKSDIYVHPSRFEGKSIAIDEAKILNKPIVVTNFTTAKEHIKNNINGLIVNMDSQSVYLGVKELIDNGDRCNHFTNNLKKEKLGNENEIQKLYLLIES